MNDLVNRIADGRATLLGIDDICTRIGVSRTTFDRWVRNGSRGTGGTVGAIAAAQGIRAISPSTVEAIAVAQGIRTISPSRHGIGSFAGSGGIGDIAANLTEGSISFPPPDIRIGNSPKWELETFKGWLQANVTAVGK